MPPHPFAHLYDAEQLQLAAQQLLPILTQHLQADLTRQNPVLRFPPENQFTGEENPPYTSQLNWHDFLALLQNHILPNSLHMHHPRNFGHQVAPPLPVAALCDMIADLTNQAMAVYEAGPTATHIEQQVIAWLGKLIGWQQPAGILTSGGSLGNLTALLAARQSTLGTSVWQHGLQQPNKIRLLAHAQSHYSISRAAAIMGIGSDAVIPVAVDEHGRMDVAALQTEFHASQRRQETVMAVVALAGCTATGSLDDLEAIADFCQQHHLWLHVDGAHGASLLLSQQYRHRLQGIHRADSVLWDAHKLMFMPATVTAVLFRKSEDSYRAFQQQSSYLFQDERLRARDTGLRTLECTKRMMGLKIWAVCMLYGLDTIGQMVEATLEQATHFSHQIQASHDFLLWKQPASNIVCFRYQPRHSLPDQWDALQISLRQKLIEAGEFYISQVTLDQQVWLRTVFMHPLTTPEDTAALLVAIRDL